MTAEIAILNKTAIALAADSAVTISAGSSQQKIFDSGDKLFELSCSDAIGIMIYSDMSFMEAPLPVLVKDYRSCCPRFDTVADAAKGFLDYLQRFGACAPEDVRQRQVKRQVQPLVDWLQELSEKEFQSRISNLVEQPETSQTSSNFADRFAAIVQTQIEIMKRILSRQNEAEFLGQSEPKLTTADADAIREVVQSSFSMANAEQKDEVAKFVIGNIKRVWPSQATTGIVIAGFGQSELFPTLMAFEVVGMVGEALKFTRLHEVDIDRNGHRARVIPFAQREMVERFLYGLDQDIERKVRTFCQRTVSTIQDKILDRFELEDDVREELQKEASDAEQAFLDGLQDGGFGAIRQDSQFEIEDMVEFMPKPEMARMAEALVNLTSIKRRVSRGMETVGGPIDVAVISKAEGFVWVKRKHYFPAELNKRYFERMQPHIGQHRESDGE